MEATETPLKQFTIREILGMLRGNDRTRHEFATATLVQAGRPIMSHLVAHAADPKKSAIQRIRILRAIKSIGYPDAPWDRAAIFKLTCDAPPTVRKAAGRLIRDLLYDTPDEPKSMPPANEPEVAQQDASGGRFTRHCLVDCQREQQDNRRSCKTP